MKTHLIHVKIAVIVPVLKIRIRRFRIFNAIVELYVNITT